MISNSVYIEFRIEAKMHIVYGKEQADTLRDRYTVLELDTVDVQEVNKKLTLYAIVDPAKVGLEGLTKLDMWVDLHGNLIKNLKLKNHKFVKDAIEHLKGQFGGELDTFYQHVEDRLK